MADFSGASADAGLSADEGPAPIGGPDPAELHDEVGLLFRRRAGQLSATLARILGLSRIDLVEDVVHDAFVRALRTWPHTGMPDNPTAWILRVARNRALDLLRREGRWQNREAELERSILPGPATDDGPPAYFAPEVEDDQLRLMFACCDPLLSLDAQIALTLKVVGAFSVAEIARAFYAPPPTVAQRIVRAKRALRDRGATLEIPSGPELSRRRDSVLEVLYLMFNEGYVAYEGEDLVRDELCAEAIRLVELVAAHPVLGAPSVHALAALFFFHAARAPGRVDPAGALVPLERQDRGAWDQRMLGRGLEHLQRAGRGEVLTPYHLQAEIAACHALAPSFAETDWAQILECYDALLPLDPSPVVALNRVVAVAEVHGAEVALQRLSDVAADGRLEQGEGRWAIEGDLLERLGRYEDAAAAFRTGAEVTRSGPVRRHLEERARAASEVRAARPRGSTEGRAAPETESIAKPPSQLGTSAPLRSACCSAPASWAVVPGPRPRPGPRTRARMTRRPSSGPSPVRGREKGSCSADRPYSRWSGRRCSLGASTGCSSETEC